MVVPGFLLPQDEGVATKSWNLDQNDPHQLPDLSSHPNFHEPLLYLPPLLSSPPEEISSDSVDIAYGNPDYPSLATETRLPSIDPVSLSLHKALHNFRPVSFDYSTLPYADAFNWSQLKLPIDEEREWYIVAFRSIRKVGSDSVSLYNADRLAHEEAVRNGGLLLYWYGVPHPETGLNLATCIWQSRKHAIAAQSRPHHIDAMRLAASGYERYTLERYRLQKTAGQESLTLEIYQGGDVGW